MHHPPVTLIGHLLRAEAVLTHGLAQLSFTLEMPWHPDDGGTPTTVECLMAYGREPHAWPACQRAAATMETGQVYEAQGQRLASVGGSTGRQLWLLGVSTWARAPGAIAPQPAELAITRAALGQRWGVAHDARVA